MNDNITTEQNMLSSKVKNKQLRYYILVVGDVALPLNYFTKNIKCLFFYDAILSSSICTEQF